MKKHMDTNMNNFVTFVPSSDLIQEEECDTLLLHLPGFKKEELRVQLDKSGVLNISGKRPIGDKKWSSFEKILNVSSNCDKSKISAKFENETLYVKQPKLIVPAGKQDIMLPRKTADEPRANREEGKSEKTTTTNEDDQVKQGRSAIESEDAKKDEKKSLHEAELVNKGTKRNLISKLFVDDYKLNAAKLKLVLAILLAFVFGMYVRGLIL